MPLRSTIPSPLGPLRCVVATHATPSESFEGHLALLDFDDRTHLARALLEIEQLLGKPEPVPTTHPLIAPIRDQLDSYFSSASNSAPSKKRPQPLTRFTLPLLPLGSEFQRLVWSELQRIPHGQTISYATLAQRVSTPTRTANARSVAMANATNFRSIVIPCHRVIGKDGSLTGYGGGLDRKRFLIAHESGQPTLWAPPQSREPSREPSL